MHRIACLSTAVALLAVPAATSQATVELLANTQGTWQTYGTVKVVTQDFATCKQRSCATNTEPSWPYLQTGINGGAAWDPIRRGLWISNGGRLSCVDPDSCRFLCKEDVAPFAPLSELELSPYPQEVGGLAFDVVNNALFMVDARNLDLHRVVLGSATNPMACEFSAKSCKIAAHIPAGYTPSGLAIDQARGLLFVGSTHPTTKANHVYVARLAAWCDKVCNVTDPEGKWPAVCPSNSPASQGISGLEFDSAKSVLYVTDGRYTSAYAFTMTTTTRYPCQLKLLACCPTGATTDDLIWRGLALRPSRGTTLGKPCSATPCSACPTMIAGSVGDPVLGNKWFALSVDNAPSEAKVAICALGFGSCAAPGLPIGLCANLLIDLKLVMTFGVATSGGVTACDARGHLPLPLPSSTALQGIELSSQWLALCAQKTVGHALSACAGFTLTH